MSSFQDWVSDSFRPCCLVYCSEKAKQIIAQNNLTPSEFLRPFGDFRGKKIQIQINEKEKEPITINNFILDFYDNDKFKVLDKDSIENYLNTMFKINEPIWNLSSPLITKYHSEPLLSMLKHFSTPWYREFEKTFMECLHFDEYELYQQPLINIFIVSIEDKTSIINSTLVKQFPKLIGDKYYDSSKESIVITLNDCKDRELSKEELEKHKSRYTSIFKTQTYFIFFWDINRGPYMSPNEGEQKKISENFKKYLHKTDIYNKDDENYQDYQNKKYGIYINGDSYKKYKEEFFQYFTNIFINKILERITVYNDVIKKNTGISKFFKKNKNNSKVNRLSDLEKALYNLGMIYFFFHNYDLANDTFKQLRNCLKDKSEKYKERVKEIKAICKSLQKKESKKEFNILDEFSSISGTNEQLIRILLIIIRLMESKVKLGNRDNTNFKIVMDLVNQCVKKVNRLIKNKSAQSFLDYFLSLLQEKLGVYNLIENKFRKFVFYMTFAGRLFTKLSPEMKNYALYCLSNLVYFIDNPSPSFTKFRIYFNKLLGEVCNSLKYTEGSLKFYKNCLEFTCISDDNTIDLQNKFLTYYLSMITQIKRDKILCSNIDLNELNIPQVDNASLFVLENDDYNIKQMAKKMMGSDEKSWLVFNKYGESLITDVYANLDESDLNHIKLIHDLTNQTDKAIANVHTDRNFHGNINQKLFVKCTIRNPLSIEVLVSSVKLYCQFFPEKSTSSQSTPQSQNQNKSKNEENKINEETKVDSQKKNNDDKGSNLEKNIIIENKENNENNNVINNQENLEQNQEQEDQHQVLTYSISEEKMQMKPGETIELELNVSSPIEGKLIVKGLEFLLFNECKIVHLFSKKTTPSLYYYIHKKKIFTIGGGSYISSSGSSSDYESRNSSELVARNYNQNNIIIPRKNKIEYIISDYKNDLYVNFPIGTTVNVFLYQLFFFPIEVINNSIKYKVRRYTIFIEECNKNKVKTFFSFITRDNKIKQRFTSEKVLIPIIPMATGKIYIKILIKFASEMKVKPIQVKRYLIKLKVKESISFEIKEFCSNLNVDKDGKTYNKIDFNIKTNLRIRNEKEIKNLVMKEPVFNKELNLLTQKNYLITNNEIHKKYVFIKENSSSSNNDIKYNLDFIRNNINIENIENETQKENENKNNTKNSKSSDNSYIIDKFNKILNNPNGNIIFFPWQATKVIINESDKKNLEKKVESTNINNNNESIISENNINDESLHKEIILQGLYPYKLKMKNSEATKIYLSYLFNKYTELNITQKKIDNEKTLIKMILNLNKIGLASMGDKIDKYEIYANGLEYQIIWLGPKKFIIKNNSDESNFTCRFNFITTLKGNIEINRISVLIYKKPENKGSKGTTINLNHITKPTSIFIE